MTDRISALHQLGFPMINSNNSHKDVGGQNFSINTSHFSGYGEFTPITVTSETTINDAHLERDKPGNRQA